MSSRLTLAGICLLAAFGLAACGGGGGGSASMEDTGPTAEEIAQMEMERQEAAEMAAAAIAANTKAAGTKRTAIAAEAAQETDAGAGGSDATPAHAIVIKRDRDGTTVEITVDGAAMDDPKFAAQDMDLGHGNSMHIRDVSEEDSEDTVEEVMIVTTDIEAPKATAFAKVAGQALNVDIAPTMDADNDGTADNDLTALAVGADLDTAPDEAVRMLVKSSAFVPGSGDSTMHTFARFQLDSDGATDGNQTIQAFTAPGTYNGADGTYRCSSTSADCTATVDDEGEITAMSAGWAFIPTMGATSDVADADYLHYGFWLKRTTDKDGAVTYNEVETFASSSLAATGDVSAVTGQATYEGGATGVYVHSVSNPDGTEKSATSGHFTADVNLTATFRQTVDNPATTTIDEADQIAPSLLNTLSGTIDNFKLAHGEQNAWSVNLQGDITEGTGVASGTANGGGEPGTYSATFHGPATYDHDDNDQTADVPTAPGSVVGEFNANFSNGSVAGGFGARKQ